MISQNLKTILDTLPVGVALAAVSKFQPISSIEEAYNAGQRIFAENRPLEMQQKFAALPKDIKWHFIGHLQTNKIKYIIDYVSVIESIDSLRLLEAVNSAAKKVDRIVDVLLEVFVAKEQTKQGFSPEEIVSLYQNHFLHEFSNVNVVGLMAMASFTDNTDQVEREFSAVKHLYDTVNSKYNGNLKTLSMGMSGDYKIAIKNGANLVRIGSSIFGSR